jgi:hypothetical protein
MKRMPASTPPPDLSLSAKVRRATANALIKKAQAGKTLTRAEMAIIEEVEAEQATHDAANRATGSAIVCTADDLRLAFDVANKTIHEWVKLGLPKLARGQYDMIACCRWWRKNIVGRDDPKDRDMNEAKRQYWVEKAARMRLEREATERKLLPKADVLKEWTWRVAEVTAGLSLLASRLPPALEGKDQIEMAETVRAEVKLIRDNYARGGKFCRSRKASKSKK